MICHVWIFKCDRCGQAAGASRETVEEARKLAQAAGFKRYRVPGGKKRDFCLACRRDHVNVNPGAFVEVEMKR